LDACQREPAPAITALKFCSIDGPLGTAFIHRTVEFDVLMHEPMPSYGIFEVTRQRAEELQRARQPPPPPQREYAVGCVEWQRQQEQARHE